MKLKFGREREVSQIVASARALEQTANAVVNNLELTLAVMTKEVERLRIINESLESSGKPRPDRMGRHKS